MNCANATLGARVVSTKPLEAKQMTRKGLACHIA